MKKFFILIGLTLGLTSSVSADALKNSLTNMMNTKDSSSMVNLGAINLNAKPKPKPKPIKKMRKKRSSKTIVAIINRHKIIKKKADAYISRRTHGQIKDFDLLPKKQKRRLIKELALPFLVADAAKKELSSLEKQTLFTRTLMQKEAKKTKIKDNEVLAIYTQMKQQALDNNATQTIPPFEKIKERLRSQMIEKQVMTKLMKDVKIQVVE
jgi:hypothetical protein